MSTQDAYSTSGGWAGGSPLTTGGVLSNYYQKLQSVDPTSGSLTVAQPAQASTQPSSISRVATTTPATTSTPTIAQTTTSTADPTTAAATATAAANATASAMTGVNSSTSSGVQASIVDPTTSTSTASNALSNLATAPAQVAKPTFSGATSVYGVSPTDGNHYSLTYNPTTNQYMAANYSTLIQTDPANAAKYQAEQAAANAAAQAYNAQVAPQLQAQALAVATWQQQQQAANLAAQTATDNANAVAAQNAADQATAFSLASGLQAPNTTAVDQSGANDLARVRSQYSSGLGGADAAAYAYAGQGAQATQAAVNQVAHNTAYANAFNSNYSTFANALTAQQTADANASGQKLNYDIQGVQDAINTLTSQSGQLEAGTKTSFDSALLPLQNQLAQYQLAVKQYGASSTQALGLAHTILGGASSLAALLV